MTPLGAEDSRTFDGGVDHPTAANTIMCALTGAKADIATGRGIGVEPAAFANKVRVVD